MQLKDSKTWKNLQEAFCHETGALASYQYYASKAKKEGYNIISAIFEETAKNEKEHAKLWFKAMHNDDVPITKQNLIDAISGEDYEAKKMYIEFAKVAREEGFNDLATLFESVAKIESYHCERFKDLLEQLNNDSLFKSDEPVIWICTNCGHIHKGKNPPESCPVCKHPKPYFVHEKFFSNR